MNIAKKSTPVPWQEDRYEAVFNSEHDHAILRHIWRGAFGDEYPEEVEPFGFVTRSDLQNIRSALSIPAGSTLLDLGCGRGGPGLWMASEIGARLIGIDIVPAAIEQAKTLRERFAVSEAIFMVGSMTKIHVATAAVAGVMSVDAFWMVLDKPRALREIARVLVPGGRTVMTTWIPRYMDVEMLFRSANLELLSCVEISLSRERQTSVYAGIRHSHDQLVATVGRRCADLLLAEAQEAPEKIADAPRCLIVAQRRESHTAHGL
jgi:SAM-dependent methyltransferase